MDLIDSSIIELTERMEDAEGDIVNKQNKLYAGDNITIDGNIISASASGGGGWKMHTSNDLSDIIVGYVENSKHYIKILKEVRITVFGYINQDASLASYTMQVRKGTYRTNSQQAGGLTIAPNYGNASNMGIGFSGVYLNASPTNVWIYYKNGCISGSSFSTATALYIDNTDSTVKPTIIDENAVIEYSVINATGWTLGPLNYPCAIVIDYME